MTTRRAPMKTQRMWAIITPEGRVHEKWQSRDDAICRFIAKDLKWPVVRVEVKEVQP